MGFVIFTLAGRKEGREGGGKKEGGGGACRGEAHNEGSCFLRWQGAFAGLPLFWKHVRVREATVATWPVGFSQLLPRASGAKTCSEPAAGSGLGGMPAPSPKAKGPYRTVSPRKVPGQEKR